MNKIKGAFFLLILLLATAAGNANAVDKRIPDDHPMFRGGEDRRPHMPKILDIMGPLMQDVASEIAKSAGNPRRVTEIGLFVKEIADEIDELYVLSMSTKNTSMEAEQLYNRVVESDRKFKEIRKK